MKLRERGERERERQRQRDRDREVGSEKTEIMFSTTFTESNQIKLSTKPSII